MKFFSLLLILCAVTVYAQQCPRCTPYCFNGDGTAKTCGSDGCGGSCGSCPFGQECCRGHCTCAPSCAGRQCGDDGCGGNSCGTCADGQTCNGGVCSGTGIRTCGNRVCGHDRIGGSCGSCSPGQRCRGGTCECFYDCNERNCGNAVTDAGTVCPPQSCGTCPSGFTCNTNGQCSALAPCNVSIVVVDRITNNVVGGSCSINITGVSVNYNRNGFAWISPSTNWDVAGGFGTYSFSTNCPGYQVNVEQSTVTTSTTTIRLTVVPAAIPVEVYKAGDFSQQLSVTCQIEVTGTNFYFASFSWTRNTGVTFTGATTNGFGSYEFTTSCPGYSPSTQTINVQASTRVIQLQVSAASVTIEVREDGGAQPLITVSASIEIYFGSTFIQTYAWRPGQSNSWVPPQYGNFTFITTASGYSVNQESRQVTASTSVVTLFVFGCGDGRCSDGESFDFCPEDCAALFLQFERYDGNTPVTGYTVRIYSQNPRTLGGQFGPVPNSAVTPTFTRTVEASSNIYSQGTFQHDEIVYLQVSYTSYINFYWTADMSRFDPTLGQVFSLRGHLSPQFTANNLPYRVVNTWRTTDNEPPPYSPTDLNLHLFFSGGQACDINNPTLSISGTLSCQSIADAKQSGGPASLDFLLSANSPITTWNTKPPRNPVIAPSQNGRYLINSGSYIVLYGITSDAATGKQLGEVTLYDTLQTVAPSNNFDIWRIADVSVAQPRQGGLTITARNFLGRATIDAQSNMRFDCQINSACSSFIVPYADTGR